MSNRKTSKSRDGRKPGQKTAQKRGQKPAGERSRSARAKTGQKAGPKSRPKPKQESRRKAGSKSRPSSSPPGGAERLQKVLAAAGAGSRRECEELILAGRVEVDRQVIVELGTKVDPALQQIRVDGVNVARPKLVYYAVNKPAGMVCTNRDPSGRPRVIDLVPNAKERLFAVGRLDLNSEGLILLTNDGDLANRLTHPRYGVEKTYQVLVAGHPTPEVMIQLRKGVRLAEGIARVAGARIKRRHKQSTILELVLEEGRNREIRRVLAKVGHKVQSLTRIAVGPVRLADLPLGQYRRLGRKEVDSLRTAVRKSKS